MDAGGQAHPDGAAVHARHLSGRQAQGRRWALVALLLVVSILGAGASVQQLRSARSEATEARGATADADAAAVQAAAGLAAVRVELQQADAALGAARQQLATVADGLGGSVTEREAVAAQLAAVEAALAALEGEVAGTESDAAAARRVVAALATCLDGVSELLNQLAVGDAIGAIATATDAGPSCAAVGLVL